MSDDELTEQEIVLAAQLLHAADAVLGGDARHPADALALTYRVWAALDEPLWSDGKHHGDCTKAAHTCFRCVVERYRAQASLRYTLDSSGDMRALRALVTEAEAYWWDGSPDGEFAPLACEIGAWVVSHSETLFGKPS